MTTLRTYRDDDASSVGRLIARTYSAFNLGFATPEQQAGLLGPFGFADSAEPAHRAAIAEAIGAPIVLVAEEAGAIVGVLRGGRVDGRGRTVLQSLFVAADHHRRGIGRRLVERFEQACPAGGVTVIKVASTLYAVPFYQATGLPAIHRRTDRAQLPGQRASLPADAQDARLSGRRRGAIASGRERLRPGARPQASTARRITLTTIPEAVGSMQRTNSVVTPAGSISFS